MKIDSTQDTSQLEKYYRLLLSSDRIYCHYACHIVLSIYMVPNWKVTIFHCVNDNMNTPFRSGGSIKNMNENRTTHYL